MNDAASGRERLWEAITGASSPEEVRAVMTKVRALRAQDNLPAAECLGLLNTGYRSLARATADDSLAAKEIILEELLPAVLSQGSDEDFDSRSTRRVLRNRLVDWIRQYADEPQAALRSAVLSRLREELPGRNVELACYAINALEYRDDETVRALWAALDAKVESRSTVVNTLVYLGGLSDEEEARLLPVIEALADEPLKSFPAHALADLRSPRALDLAASLLEKIAADETQGGWHTMKLFGAFADAAERARDHPAQRDALWERVAQLQSLAPESFARTLFFAGGVASRFDTGTVIPSLLSWATMFSQNAGDEIGQRSRAYSRVKDCLRPQQLDGWCRDWEPATVAMVEADATQGPTATGRGNTMESSTKEEAWEVALCGSREDALDWGPTAIERETDPHVRWRFLRKLALLAVRDLPAFVEELVRDDLDATGAESSGRMFEREGAIRVARSCATWAAFDALVDFGLTDNGEVLLTTANAVEEVALHLAREDASRVISVLALLAEDRAASSGRRSVAVRALRALASAHLLPKRSYEQLRAIVIDDGLPLHARSEALGALGLGPDDALTAQRPFVEKIAQESVDEELQYRACAILADSTGDDTLRVVEDRLGLEAGEPRWSEGDLRELAAWPALVLGLLWNRDPQRYGRALATVIESGSDRSLWQLEATLRADSVVSDSAIVAALESRVGRSQSRLSMDLTALRLFARLAPIAFAEARWEERLGRWRPEARSALAELLGDLAGDHPATRRRAIVLLRHLSEDVAFGPRRSAFRALAEFVPDALESMVREWFEAGRVSLRVRAAEALEWLPGDADLQVGFLTARDLRVAEAARSALAAAERHSWVRAYLDRILAAPTPDVLDVYRFGRAVQELGDDRTAFRVGEFLAREHELPPNYRFWLEEVARATRERWKKVTRKWPDPLEALETSLEDRAVTLVGDDGREFDCRGTFWKRPGHLPDQLDSWGCALEVADEEPMFFAAALPGEVTLRFAPDCEGRALVSALSGNALVLHGTGPYPSSGGA